MHALRISQYRRDIRFRLYNATLFLQRSILTVKFTECVCLPLAVRKLRKGRAHSRRRPATRPGSTAQWCTKEPVTESMNRHRPRPSTCCHHLQSPVRSASRCLFFSSNLFDGYCRGVGPCNFFAPCDLGPHYGPSDADSSHGWVKPTHP